MKNSTLSTAKEYVPFKIKLLSITLEVIVGLFILLWIYTGLNKMIDYSNFKTQLAKSPFIQSFDGLIANTLPAFELIIAGLLIFNKTRLIGLYASLFIMAQFTGYVYIMLTYSYDLPCSCGGILEKLSWNDHLWFNAIFTLLATAGILMQVRKQGYRAN